jgi:hypothetical protein
MSALPKTAHRRILVSGAKKVVRKYDSVNGVLYAGVAVLGTATDEPKWKITKITLGENESLDTVEIVFNGVWDNRETEVYT